MADPTPAASGFPAAVPPETVARGIVMAVTAFALFSGLDVIVKLLTARYALPQIIFLNAVFSLGPVLAYAAVRGGVLASLRTRRLRLHGLRALCGVCSGFCTFFAYSRMPIADVYALAFAAPMIMTALSVPVLKEQVGWRRWTAVAVGFGGVLLMLRPGRGMVDVGALAALAGAFFYSSGMIISRLMRGTETSVSFAFYSAAAAMAATAGMLPFFWQTPTLADLGLSALGGTLGGTALVILLTAFRQAPTAVVAPFQYTQLLWGVFYGWVFFGHLPDAWLFLGGGIVIGSGLYILHRETRRTVPQPPRLPQP
ncbi:DMT family transporter [Rhodocista pekingensis]|uniref:DMT family transporter n=1 Tax=Rhodocista pekingensis TaxID=201185 RepID=A0ABW2KWN2_9PROT